MHSLPDLLKKRAWLYQTIREFMATRQVLEVETPHLNIAANTDPNIDSLATTVNVPDLPDPRQYFFHTSPELFMKRLIARGSGSIYQICKVFRDNESGPMHGTEFSMLEYYQLHYDYHQLMDEINELLEILGFKKASRQSYASVVESVTGLDPHTAETAEIQAYTRTLGLIDAHLSRSALLDLVFSHRIVPSLKSESPVFIYDFPVCQAALASISETEPACAQRFELFIDCIEISNGYNELLNYFDYSSRFDQENITREKASKSPMPIDQAFLQDLKGNLPQCSGVSIGLDRLLMVLTDSKHLGDVLAFNS